MNPPIIHLDVVDSTNAELTRIWLAEAAAVPYTTVSCEFQSQGRGRSGRKWRAERGSALMASVLVPIAADSLVLQGPGWVTLAAGLAARAALQALFVAGAPAGGGGDVGGGGVPEVALKWPNDLMVGGRKIGGILAELATGPRQNLALVIGFGINLDMAPGALPTPQATSALVEGLALTPQTRSELLDSLLDRLPGYLDPLVGAGAAGVAAQGDVAQGQAAAMLEEYRRHCVTLGREVVVDLPGGACMTGRAEGISPGGGLLVRTAAGVLREITAGDAHLLGTRR